MACACVKDPSQSSIGYCVDSTLKSDCLTDQMDTKYDRRTPHDDQTSMSFGPVNLQGRPILVSKLDPHMRALVPHMCKPLEVWVVLTKPVMIMKMTCLEQWPEIQLYWITIDRLGYDDGSIRNFTCVIYIIVIYINFIVGMVRQLFLWGGALVYYFLLL